MSTFTATDHDPLAKFQNGARIKGSNRPIPLLHTEINVRIVGGLAVVRTERLFRNAEESGIEAIITFPVPVHATMVALAASVDGRNLVGQAQRKQQARASYETAIDEGRTAVLHEEAIRGIHILSVGNIPPGKDIRVASTWAMPLSRQGDVVMLRIPVTVGDIYGRSPLADVDDLVHAPVRHEAELSVSSDTGIILMRGIDLDYGRARIVLDRPIDVTIAGWRPRMLHGVAADGRRVTLEIGPAEEADADLDAVLLLDQSGSMREPAAGGQTKHDVMVSGLRQVLATQRRTDRVRLWQFDTECQPAASLDELWGPRGGTEIGRALQIVAANSDARDIAIVTDGKSHHLDVQALARTGKRFTVILIGEDSLEAHIGHLAALTGGELFVVSGREAANATIAALNAMRRHHVVQPPLQGLPATAVSTIGGMAVTAHWNDALPADAHSATASGSEPDHPASDLAHASVIGAVAAAIAIPYMDAGTAMAFAEAHNIVCHLTSLVLVDQAGEVMDSLPAQRKVPLMSPATVQVSQPAGRPALRQTINADAGRQSLFGTTTGAFRRRTAFVVASAPVRRPKARACEPAENASAVQSAMTQTLALLKSWVGRIDWSNAEALRQGDTSALDPQLVALIMSASRTEAVEELARTVGASSVAVVIALLARASAGNDRNAARVFRAVLGGADPDQMHAAAQAMGL